MPYAILQDEEAEIRQQLESLNLPDSIVETRLFFDNDWTGDPSVYVYFILSDSLGDKEFQEEATRIRAGVMETLYNNRTDRIPYVSFRTKSGQDAIDRERRRGR